MECGSQMTVSEKKARPASLNSWITPKTGAPQPPKRVGFLPLALENQTCREIEPFHSPILEVAATAMRTDALRSETKQEAPGISPKPMHRTWDCLPNFCPKRFVAQGTPPWTPILKGQGAPAIPTEKRSTTGYLVGVVRQRSPGCPRTPLLFKRNPPPKEKRGTTWRSGCFAWWPRFTRAKVPVLVPRDEMAIDLLGPAFLKSLLVAAFPGVQSVWTTRIMSHPSGFPLGPLFGCFWRQSTRTPTVSTRTGPQFWEITLGSTWPWRLKGRPPPPVHLKFVNVFNPRISVFAPVSLLKLNNSQLLLPDAWTLQTCGMSLLRTGAFMKDHCQARLRSHSKCVQIIWAIASYYSSSWIQGSICKCPSSFTSSSNMHIYIYIY